MNCIKFRRLAQALTLAFVVFQALPAEAHAEPGRSRRASPPPLPVAEPPPQALSPLEQIEREKIANEIEANLLHFSFSWMSPQVDRAAGGLPLGYWYQGLTEVVGDAPFAQSHAKKAYQYRVAGQSLAWGALGLWIGDIIWLTRAGSGGRQVSKGVAWGGTGVALAGLGAEIAAVGCLIAANSELGTAVRYANEAVVERAIFGGTKVRAGLGLGPSAAVMATLGGEY